MIMIMSNELDHGFIWLLFGNEVNNAYLIILMHYIKVIMWVTVMNSHGHNDRVMRWVMSS